MRAAPTNNSKFVCLARPPPHGFLLLHHQANWPQWLGDMSWELPSESNNYDITNPIPTKNTRKVFGDFNLGFVFLDGKNNNYIVDTPFEA